MKVKYTISDVSLNSERMFCVCFIAFGLLLRVHSSSIFEASDKCLTFSKKEQCTNSNFNITCGDGLVIITLIVFGDSLKNTRKECDDCLDVREGPIIDVSGGQFDTFINYILETCLFRHACSLPLLQKPDNDISISYRCIPEKGKIDPCETKSSVLNMGDTQNLFMRRSNQSGECSCVVNGSTEVTIQDFFTIFDKTIQHKSKSVLRLDGNVYDAYQNSNIVHSDIVHKNVSSVSIIFDGIFRRLWLSVNITGNATQIQCGLSATNNFTTALTTITKSTNGKSTPSHSTTHAATVESTITANETEINVLSIEKTTQPLKQSPDTLNIVNASTSLLVYMVSGSAAVVVVSIVVGGIVFLRHRRIRFMKSTMAANTNLNRGSRSSAIDSTIEATVDNKYAFQTVSHIPHITKGSVKYAVAVPPGPYNYAFTQHDRDASHKFRSMAEQTASSKSDAKLAAGEEGLCHPYFLLRSLDEQGIGPTADIPCTDERDIRSADVDKVTEQPTHVYNHIMFGSGATEVEVDNDSGFICSDEYSRISIDGVKASGDGRYYNMHTGRSEPVDEYCHIGQNNANFHAHVLQDDYNHVVLKTCS